MSTCRIGAAGVVGRRAEPRVLPTPVRTARSDRLAASHPRRLARRGPTTRVQVSPGDQQRDGHLGGGAPSRGSRPAGRPRPARCRWTAPRAGPGRWPPRPRCDRRCACGTGPNQPSATASSRRHHPGRGAEDTAPGGDDVVRRARAPRAGSAPGAPPPPARTPAASRTSVAMSNRPSAGTSSWPWSAVTSSAASAGSPATRRSSSRSTVARRRPPRRRSRRRARGRRGPGRGGSRRPGRAGPGPQRGQHPGRPARRRRRAPETAARGSRRRSARCPRTPAGSPTVTATPAAAAAWNRVGTGCHTRRVRVVAPVDVVEHPAVRRADGEAEHPVRARAAPRCRG